MEGSTDTLFNGQHFDQSSIAFFTPGSGFDNRSGPGTQYCVVSVSSAAFELFLAANQNHALFSGDPDLDSHIIFDPVRAQTLRQMTHQGVKMATEFAGNPSARNILLGFQTSLINLMVSFVGKADKLDQKNCHADDGRNFSPALRAREYLHEVGAANTSIVDMVQYLGVSRRKLEYDFCHRFGLPPGKYIRRAKLNEFRLALLAEGNRNLSIGDIAAQFGIWHQSRLSQDYRLLFGELPSQARKSRNHGLR